MRVQFGWCRRWCPGKKMSCSEQSSTTALGSRGFKREKKKKKMKKKKRWKKKNAKQEGNGAQKWRNCLSYSTGSFVCLWKVFLQSILKLSLYSLLLRLLSQFGGFKVNIFDFWFKLVNILDVFFFSGHNFGILLQIGRILVFKSQRFWILA